MNKHSSAIILVFTSILAMALSSACTSTCQRTCEETVHRSAGAPSMTMPLETPRMGAPVITREGESFSPNHPDEPRLATDEPEVFRSAGRPDISRMAPAPVFEAMDATNTPVWFGLLHAHTLYSDGSGTPTEAFGRAKSVGLDFLAVTAHNHASAEMGAKGTRRDGILIATNPDLYSSPDPQTFTREFKVNGVVQTEQLTADSLITAAGVATDGNFVALFGQEFSSISSGNHINVIGAESVITVPNGDFEPLYTQYSNDGSGSAPPVLQMNHPHVHNDLFYGGSKQRTLNAMFNDYGLDEFNREFAALVAAADSLVSLVEVLTGPAMEEEIQPSFHYPSRLKHDNDYYYYLTQGFHISPSVGQDNHYKTWGDVTPARMGVMATELTREALLAAMRENRTYATEDPDLHIELRINGQAMGSVLSMATGEALDVAVQVSDSTEPLSGYVVELFYGEVLPQDENSLHKWVLADGFVDSFSFEGDGVLTFDEMSVSGQPEFFLVRVQQADGDRAWSAPIWINHPR